MREPWRQKHGPKYHQQFAKTAKELTLLKRSSVLTVVQVVHRMPSF